TCQHCEQNFTIEPEDFDFYAKIGVPEPKLCPDCRERRRLVFRNERNYYPRKCDLCGKQIVSVYDPARTKNVFCGSCWWSDKWEPLTYGRDFDFTKTFNEQYRELLRDVPKLAMMNDNGVSSEGCEYTYDFAFGKNDYMVVASWKVEDCMYGFQTNHCKACVDCHSLLRTEESYECVACNDSYGLKYCDHCFDCLECAYGYDLKNCQDCLFCVGLRGKKYCIWNQQLTIGEYNQQKTALLNGSWLGHQKNVSKFNEFKLQFPRRFAFLVNCEDSTGDNLFNCHNAKNCYIFNDLHNCKYTSLGDTAKDCYDCTDTGNPELSYDSVTPDNSCMELFGVYGWKCQFVTYSENCHSSSDLFGCVGLRQKKFCIFNKQYSETEYKSLREKIVEHMKKLGEWGEFFDPKTSMFAYNETAAQVWHPTSREEVTGLGYSWIEKIPGAYGRETIKVETLPDTIGEVQDTICKEILACRLCSRNYKILKQELDFYRRKNLPLPHECIECRHFRRVEALNPKKLWSRQCQCEVTGHNHGGRCAETFETTYAPERPEKVYCERCYLEEIG
ncbi:MAG: hypothetical protein V1821_00210, partial [bacterium]